MNKKMPPKIKMTTPKPAPKPKAAAPAPPTRFNQQGKPDPAGHYDKEGFMVEVPGKRNKFEKKPAGRSKEEIEIAKRNGFAS